MKLNIKLKLPQPYDLQQEIIDSPAKRKVVACGRRAGKTTLDEIIAMRKFLEGGVVVYACPVSKQTAKFWRDVKSFLGPLINEGLVYKNENLRYMESWNGGRIECQTAYNADTLRGDACDVLILDEFQDMVADAWYLVGAPMLLDSDGDAIFTFTSKRRNHAYDIYRRGLADSTGFWQSWRFPSFANPHISKSALDNIRADMGEMEYRQEILAEFLENTGGVFMLDDSMFVQEPERSKELYYVAGIDWGRVNDYTAISIFNSLGQECLLKRFRGTGYLEQIEELVNIMQRFGVVFCLAEGNSAGATNVELLQQKGINAQPLFMTNKIKGHLVDRFRAGLELGDYKILPDPVGKQELLAYETNVSKTGLVTFSAPEGVNDDTIIARILAASALARHGALFLE